MEAYIWRLEKKTDDKIKQFARDLSKVFTGELELLWGMMGITQNANIAVIKANKGIIKEKAGKTFVSFDTSHIKEFEEDIDFFTENYRQCIAMEEKNNGMVRK